MARIQETAIFILHPRRSSNVAYDQYLWETSPEVVIIGVDNAGEDQLDIFLPAVRAHVLMHSGRIPRYGIHAKVGMYNGKTFDNTNSPRFIVEEGDWVLMADETQDYANMIKVYNKFNNNHIK